MKLRVELGRDSYDITIEKNAIKKAGELFNLDRKVMIVTDSGVPEEYGDEVYDQCKEASITVIPEGEENKNFEKPSDIQGLIYIPFQNKVDEVAINLIRELSRQGINIDSGRI